MTDAELAELLRPPTEAEVAQALARFAGDVRRHYGERLKGLYLFGSRARGDHTPESDADVAVILQDGDWEEWIERRTLNGMAYNAGFDSGLSIQPWPLSHTDWASARSSPRTRLIGEAHSDAVSLDDRS